MDNYEWLGTILGGILLAAFLLWVAPVLGVLVLWVTGLSLAWLVLRWIAYRFF